MKRRQNPESLISRRMGRHVRSAACSIALVLVSLAAAPMASARVTVSVTAVDATASETPPDNGRFVIKRTGGSFIEAVTVAYELTGTATAGTDYGQLPGVVSLGILQSEASVLITMKGDDGIFEGDETVTIKLLKDKSSDVNVKGGDATVTIHDSLYAVTAANDSNASEGPLRAGRILVSLAAENQSGRDVNVNYNVGGTADAGTDYETLNGVAVIPNGSSSASIDVTPLADDRLEGDETVTATLTSTSSPNAPLGESVSGSVTILDDDVSGDDDNDGLLNLDECPGVSACPDTDGDSTPDYQDADDDGDGVPTASENAPSQDTDADGIFDYLDDNDDGDERLTREEDANPDGDGNPATSPTDLDKDGISDYLDADDQSGPGGDPDGDGLTNEREAELGTDPGVADTDGDGVNDGDEEAAGTDPLDAASFADTDGDLVPDAEEAADGTDPGDPASFLDSDGGGTADHIETVTYPGAGIDPTNIMDGNDDRRDFDGDGLPDRLEISLGSEPGSSESPTASGAADDSGNGVTNAVEAYLATLGIEAIDNLNDFDRDGYPDAMEVTFGLNPLDSAANDSDGDGVPNAVELAAGVDIAAATDSDADGIPDAREIALASDPLDANSPVADGALDDDGDGVSNGIEQVLQTLGVTSDVDGVSDGDADGLSDADEIRLGTDPLRDEQPVPWIELSQAGIGTVRALHVDGGNAAASAFNGGYATGLLYDWRESDNAVLAVASGLQTGRTLTFSPATLPPGVYTLALSVQRTVGSFSSSASVVEFAVSVLPADDKSEIADADSDGVPDSADKSDARLGFANTLPAELAGEAPALIKAPVGIRLQLGSTARAALANSARVTRGDIADVGDGHGGTTGNSEDGFDYNGGIYDFAAIGLPEAGAVAQFVIPQAAPIGEFAQYRKFLPASGWRDFVEDADNRIESAAGAIGMCPEAGDASYKPGLTAGQFCIQVTLEDGGPNDGDAVANGVIVDPSGVGTPQGEVVVGQGGGAVAPAMLVVLGLFVLGAAWQRRRTGSALAVAALFCCGLAALPATARADAFVGAGAGMAALDPDTAGTPFSIADDRDYGFKVFGGFDLTPVSPKLSVEVLFAQLGQATLATGGNIDYSLYGAGLLYGIGSVDAPRFSGFVEAGVARLDISADVPLKQQDDTAPFLGIGGSFAVRRHLFLQLEYEYFAEDAQFLSLSLVKRFRLDSSPRVETIPLPTR